MLPQLFEQVVRPCGVSIRAFDRSLGEVAGRRGDGEPVAKCSLTGVVLTKAKELGLHKQHSPAAKVVDVAAAVEVAKAREMPGAPSPSQPFPERWFQ